MVLGSNPASSDTVELEGWQMKLCRINSPGLKWITNKVRLWGQPVQYVISNFHLYRVDTKNIHWAPSLGQERMYRVITLLYSILFTSLCRKTFKKKEKGFSRGVSTSVGIPFRCFKKQRRPMHEGSIHKIGISYKSFKKYWRISINRNFLERKDSPEESPQVVVFPLDVLKSKGKTGNAPNSSVRIAYWHGICLIIFLYSVETENLEEKTTAKLKDKQTLIASATSHPPTRLDLIHSSARSHPQLV